MQKLERIVPPTQKPVEKVQREPSPTTDASNGQCVSKATPEPPSKMDLPLADPLPADDLGERIAKLFASFFALRRQQLLFLARVPSLSFQHVSRLSFCRDASQTHNVTKPRHSRNGAVSRETMKALLKSFGRSFSCAFLLLRF